MRKLLLISVFFIPYLSVISQIKIDVGGFVGGSFYLGDINTSRLFYSTKIAGGALYRYNFNPRYALRGSIIYGNLSGNDKDFSNQYQQLRNQSFNTPLVDVTFQAEFNFLPYVVASDKNTYSSYILSGVSYFMVPNTNTPHQLAIPLGMGLKFNLKRNWAAGVEWSFRKTFTDDIDGLDGKSFFMDTHKQTGFANNRDWYSFCGIFLTYMIYNEEMKCAAYDEKK